MADDMVGRAILYYGSWEQDILDTLDAALLRDPNVHDYPVVDIGANIGDFTMFAGTDSAPPIPPAYVCAVRAYRQFFNSGAMCSLSLPSSMQPPEAYLSSPLKCSRCCTRCCR